MEYITVNGIMKMNQKLERLKASLPEVVKQVSAAREMGDLSENAEYHAARERKRNIENEIDFITTRLSKLQVIDTKSMDTKAVRFGFCVRVAEKQSGENTDYILVGADEIDFDFGQELTPISFLSPLGKALIGKEVGQSFVVSAPKGNMEYFIVKIWRG